jgi:hypothetical protein
MRLPGFTAVLAVGNSRRRYYQSARAVAGTQGVVLPAKNPSGGGGGGISGGGGGGISGGGWCPAQPWKLAPPGACPSDGVFDGSDPTSKCNYAQERCACYGETDPSGCCDYYDGNCLNVGPPGYPGDGGGGPVGGPPHHGPVLF